MSEIKQNKQNLKIVKNGEGRSPDTSYTEYLTQDSKKVPEFMVEENFEFLGSEDIDTSRYISREFFEKKRIVCGPEYGSLHAELRIYLR